jgi:CoA:oxalate CoA-transferase
MLLTGLRVVDLTRVLSGPFCTMLLADLGAEVIKVEPPEGDPVRRQGVIKDGQSWYFATFNRNKRSIVLDLKSEEGRTALAELIAGADALVENFRPGVLDRLGFPRARLRELQPRLVSCSINGFGSWGPYRDRPAFDFIAQAMSGFMSVNGRADDPPLRSGLPISDLVAGLYGAFGVCAALLKARETGEGEHVEIALTNGLISFMAYFAANYFATGEALERTGNDHPIAAPYGLFPTADHSIALAPSDDAFFGRLVEVLGRPELKSDPRFARQPSRVQNRAEINAIVSECLRRRPAGEWIELFNRAGVPCGPVYTVSEMFSDPQVIAQGMAVEVEQPGHGTVRMLGRALKTERESPYRPAPELGADTDAIMKLLKARRG